MYNCVEVEKKQPKPLFFFLFFFSFSILRFEGMGCGVWRGWDGRGWDGRRIGRRFLFVLSFIYCFDCVQYASATYFDNAPLALVGC